MRALREMHSKPGWMFVPELRVEVCYGTMNEQRLDGWAMNAWKGNRKAPMLRRSFEVKTQLQDVMKELRDPDKRWMAYAVSHEFYFVAPAGLIDPKLLDKDDGLMDWDGTVLKIVKRAKVRGTMQPRWSFVGSLVRTLLLKEERESNEKAYQNREGKESVCDGGDGLPGG